MCVWESCKEHPRDVVHLCLLPFAENKQTTISFLTIMRKIGVKMTFSIRSMNFILHLLNVTVTFVSRKKLFQNSIHKSVIMKFNNKYLTSVTYSVHTIARTIQLTIETTALRRYICWRHFWNICSHWKTKLMTQKKAFNFNAAYSFFPTCFGGHTTVNENTKRGYTVIYEFKNLVRMLQKTTCTILTNEH